MTDQELISIMKTKLVKQRGEIGRLTHKLEALTQDKTELLRDIKWMRGEEELK